MRKYQNIPMPYTLLSTPEYRAWKSTLTTGELIALTERLTLLRIEGPQARRPYFDVLRGGANRNLKEIVVTKKAQRALFIFDPTRNAVLLLGGNKSEDYEGWYERHIPLAERIYETYLTAKDREPYQEE